MGQRGARQRGARYDGNVCRRNVLLFEVGDGSKRSALRRQTLHDIAMSAGSASSVHRAALEPVSARM
jgi:hypothetical protein